MPKPTTIYVCGNCDAQSPKWTGQCLECGAWGSLQAAAAPSQRKSAPSAAAAADPIDLAAIDGTSEERSPTGIGELDRALGGGIVAGSVTLLGGEPGIGKSTLSLMICGSIAARSGNVLYVSGEESAPQVKMRATRLGMALDRLRFLAETDVDRIVATFRAERPSFAVIDSVQMLSCSDIPSEAGAANQVRGAVARIMHFAKTDGVPVFLIGHVTKDGSVAGPKTLEHLVDTVLSFEGERTGELRLLRSPKNRFGPTDETGIFSMTDAGLVEVANPSAHLLEERRAGMAGSAVTCVLEGTRPILVEVQALVQRTSFGYPARKVSGIDAGRLEMLLAVLAKRGNVDLGQHDVFVNVVGGLKLKEPAADLAVILALASAARNAPVPEMTVVWGEVGLGGELRPAPGTDRRLAEAAALGLRTVIAPLPRSGKAAKRALRVIDAKSVGEALAGLKAAATA